MQFRTHYGFFQKPVRWGLITPLDPPSEQGQIPLSLFFVLPVHRLSGELRPVLKEPEGEGFVYLLPYDDVPPPGLSRSVSEGQTLQPRNLQDFKLCRCIPARGRASTLYQPFFRYQHPRSIAPIPPDVRLWRWRPPSPRQAIEIAVNRASIPPERLRSIDGSSQRTGLDGLAGFAPVGRTRGLPR